MFIQNKGVPQGLTLGPLLHLSRLTTSNANGTVIYTSDQDLLQIKLTFSLNHDKVVNYYFLSYGMLFGTKQNRKTRSGKFVITWNDGTCQHYIN